MTIDSSTKLEIIKAENGYILEFHRRQPPIDICTIAVYLSLDELLKDVRGLLELNLE